MSYEFYKIVHLVGLALLFAALGGGLFAPRGDRGAPPKVVTVLHGIGALLMLVGGFGLLARIGIAWPWPTWVLVKVVAWVVLGVAPFAMRRLPRIGAIFAAVLVVALTSLVGLAVAMVQLRPE